MPYTDDPPLPHLEQKKSSLPLSRFQKVLLVVGSVAYLSSFLGQRYLPKKVFWKLFIVDLIICGVIIVICLTT